MATDPPPDTPTPGVPHLATRPHTPDSSNSRKECLGRSEALHMPVHKAIHTCGNVTIPHHRHLRGQPGSANTGGVQPAGGGGRGGPNRHMPPGLRPSHTRCQCQHSCYAKGVMQLQRGAADLQCATNSRCCLLTTGLCTLVKQPRHGGQTALETAQTSAGAAPPGGQPGMTRVCVTLPPGAGCCTSHLHMVTLMLHRPACLLLHNVCTCCCCRCCCPQGAAADLG